MLEFCILTIIHRTEEAYTSDILAALQQADLLVVEGTIYPLLTRMKNNGILAYRWQESKDGPPRKYYRITEAGQNLLVELRQEWDAISRSINGITASTPSSAEDSAAEASSPAAEVFTPTAEVAMSAAESVPSPAAESVPSSVAEPVPSPVAESRQIPNECLTNAE